MKLWDKGQTSTSDIIDQFTVGNDRVLDLQIAEYDLRASQAHAQMLNSIGLLSDQELKDLLRELNNLVAEVKEGTFLIEEAFEDVHSKIEYELTRKLGETGKKIHAGRSRNDQVLVCMHMYVKEQIQEIKEHISELFEMLIDLSERHKEVLIPGYTHMQVAMPSSFGLWFGACAETMIDDMYMINAAYEVDYQNHLISNDGSGCSLSYYLSSSKSLLD